MTEQEALARMIAPGTSRQSKWRSGVIQIRLTRACDRACFGCSQGSQLAGKPSFMTPDQFEQAVLSLRGYFGVYGVFGGNPALSPYLEECCEILRKHVPREQCGLWCNDPLTAAKGAAMRATFDPAVSNLNCHLSREAYDRFKTFWPESMPFGLHQDSRHSPPFVAMKDVEPDEGKRWELISGCDINQRWSALVGLFRGELRAWFCEIAAAQSEMHEHEPDYPDTGLDPTWTYLTARPDGLEREVRWWELPMQDFAKQVRQHCHTCGVPLRGHGALAQDESGTEQVSEAHAAVFRPKRKGRAVELVTTRTQLGEGRITRATDYLQNVGR